MPPRSVLKLPPDRVEVRFDISRELYEYLREKGTELGCGIAPLARMILRAYMRDQQAEVVA